MMLEEIDGIKNVNERFDEVQVVEKYEYDEHDDSTTHVVKVNIGGVEDTIDVKGFDNVTVEAEVSDGARDDVDGYNTLSVIKWLDSYDTKTEIVRYNW